MDKVDRGDEKDIDKKVNDKGRPEGIAPVNDIAEENAGDDSADRFQFRFAEMDQDKGDHLNQDRALFETVLETEDQKSAEKELRSEQASEIDQEVRQKVEVFDPVVLLELGAVSGKK